MPNDHSLFKDDLNEIVQLLNNGSVILYPTDTIWGIGCDATNSEAIERIYTLKRRPKEKSFILLVDDIPMLKDYVQSIHPRIETLLSFHDKPLTVIYKKGKNLPENVLGPKGSIAIRVVKDAFCREIIEKLGKPLVSTSANISGDPHPKHFGEIRSDILSGVDYIAQHRRDDREDVEPSVIVKYGPKGDLEFIRN